MRVFSIVGGCAKTALVGQLVAELKARGMRISTVKHVPDSVDLDTPGSGSWKHRMAGAEETILASRARIALLREATTDNDECDIDELLARLAPVDIVLLDGFRLNYYPKLEFVQPDRDRRLIALDDPMVLAVTAERATKAPVPFLLSSDIVALADFVLANAITATMAAPLAAAAE